MSPKGIGINIRNKCPKESNKGTCQDDDQIVAIRRKLEDVGNRETGYKYCIHRNETTLRQIKDLNYGGNRLKIEGNAGESTLFSTVHPEVWEVTTYYHKDHDNGRTTIKVPLALRVQSKTSEDDDKITWYENTDADGDNTTWKKIGNTSNFPEDDTEVANTEFIQKLNKLTCQLHKLHIVNIYAKSDYKCACGEAEVNVENKDGDVEGYTKYNYKYKTKENSVRYKSVNIKDADDGDKPLRLDKHTPSLSVYYWKEDKKRTKPLMLEVAVGNVGNMKAYYSNKGEQNNRKWMSIDPEDGFELEGDELEKKLQELKCKFFRPADIDISKEEGEYPNPYCNTRSCKNKECSKNLEVNKYHLHDPNGYTAWRHTYGEQGETFTITNFIGGPSRSDSPPGFFPIFDATKALVFFPKCSKGSPGNTNTHTIVHVHTRNGGARTWYKNSCQDSGEWMEGTLGRSSLDKAYTNLLKATQETSRQEVRLAHGDYEDSEGQDSEEIEEPGDIEVERSRFPPQQTQGPVNPSPQDSQQLSSSINQGNTQVGGLSHGKELLRTVNGTVGPLISLGLDLAATFVPLAVNTALKLAVDNPKLLSGVIDFTYPGEKGPPPHSAELSQSSDGEVPAADLSDQVPDTESETKVLLEGKTGLLGGTYYVTDTGEFGFGGEAGPPSPPKPTTGTPVEKPPQEGKGPPILQGEKESVLTESDKALAADPQPAQLQQNKSAEAPELSAESLSGADTVISTSPSAPEEPHDLIKASPPTISGYRNIIALPGSKGENAALKGHQQEAHPEAAAKLEASVPSAPKAEQLVAETVATGSVLWTAFGSTSGTLAGSAATFFAGWKLYNRYKGNALALRMPTVTTVRILMDVDISI